jgi:hypothetical protein
MSLLNRYCLILAGLSCFAVLVPAQTLYGITGEDGDASTLYTINTTTGAVTTVGATGFNGVGSLAFAPDGVTLYGVSGNNSGGGHHLIRINTSTGVGTAVSGNVTGNSNIADIAFRSDGVLFASGGSDGASPLYTINTTTGIATLIGTMANSGGGNALAFNASGTLYLCSTNALLTVNTTTAATTQVGQLNWEGNNFGGMKFQPGTGTLFLTDVDGDVAKVTTFSGANIPVTTISLSPSEDFEGLAFGGASAPPPPPPSGVPAPSTLLLLVTGLAIVARWSFLRRRQGIRT